MAWSDIERCYRDLRSACDNGVPLGDAWRAFVGSVEATQGASPPYHLRTLLEVLETARRPGLKRAETAILEHGCGSGLTSLYLLALGYTGVHGVDVGGGCEAWNRLLADEYCIGEKRFFIYDGVTLPLPDRSIDVVFSEQVLEHVSPSAIEAYYREEGRILKPGGIAYHMVPHRLAPYDSHTRTWFVHYMPRRAQLAAYRILGHDPDYIAGMLHLRWPGYHRRQLRRHIGPYKDVTAARLMRSVDPTYYDAPLGLRNLMRRGAALPIIGALARAILRNFVMLETVAVKR